MLNSTTTDTYTQVSRRLCHFLPEDLKHTCEDAVRQLPQSLYRCAVQEADLNTICSDPSVGMCKVPTRPLSRVQCKNLPGYVHTCAACKFVVGGLSHYMLESLDQMVASLESVCMVRFRDDTERKQCETFVREEGANAVRVAVSRLDAQDFCCAAGICIAPPLFVDKVRPEQLASADDPSVGPVSEMMAGVQSDL